MITKQEVAEKSFMLGVNWLLKILTAHEDLWNVDEADAEILRRKAQKVISTLQKYTVHIGRRTGDSPDEKQLQPHGNRGSME